MRRAEREILDKATIANFVLRQKTVTLAMCQENKPYLVTVNYWYDKKENHLYFHCATTGKKIDILLANPEVCGTIFVELGYNRNEITFEYESVHIYGQAEELPDRNDKIKVMIKLLTKFDSPMKAKKLLTSNVLRKFRVFRIKIRSMEGKANPPLE